MGQKPDDWNTLSLCKLCHRAQHTHGELTFWKAAEVDPTAMAEEFAAKSPKAADIRRAKAERLANG